MKKIHFLIDIRRHRGDSNFIIGLIQPIYGRPASCGRRVVGPNGSSGLKCRANSQSDKPTPTIQVGLLELRPAFVNSASRDQRAWSTWFSRNDGYFLNAAERLAYSDNLRVKTKHLGDLMKLVDTTADRRAGQGVGHAGTLCVYWRPEGGITALRRIHDHPGRSCRTHEIDTSPW